MPRRSTQTVAVVAAQATESGIVDPLAGAILETSEPSSPRSNGWDAVVIGGGPAGLTGALYLARFRRSVLLLDDGRSRAARIPRSHNYPGFADGVPGAELVSTIRRQAQAHGVATAPHRVVSIVRQDAGFELGWDGGGAFCRKLLLATGVSDVEPGIPHEPEALMRGVLRYCPVCDGYEVSGRAVGLLLDGPMHVGEALYLRHFTSEVTVFLASKMPRLPAVQSRQLSEAGIEVVHVGDRRDVEFCSGGVTIRQGDRAFFCHALYVALGLNIHTALATALGASRDHEGYLSVDRHHQTSVAGLYAAGDVAQGLNQICVATGAAAIAASAMHLALGVGCA